MRENLGERPPLIPRAARVVHPGPRVRILEVTLLLHVALAFVAGLGAGALAQRGQNWAAILLAVFAACILIVDARRFAALKWLRRLAADGAITSARVVATTGRRLSRARRADRALPVAGLPFVVDLEVHYEFTTPDGAVQHGRFLEPRTDASVWVPGTPVEVFYLVDEPERNLPSLVLRWYFRLGGSDKSDEAPAGTVDEEAEDAWNG